MSGVSDASPQTPLEVLGALLRSQRVSAELSLRELSARVDDLASQAGRDPAAITRATSLSLSEPLDEVRRSAGTWQAAGFGYLVCGWPAQGEARVAEFAASVLPDFAG